MDALVGAVYLVDDDDDPVAELKCPRQDEAGLRHRALGCIDKQDNAVDHLEDTLDLAAEVSVSRGVNDIDLCIAVLHGSVFRHDGNAALTLKVVGVHYALNDLLIFTVDAALLEHLVNKGGLAVVDMGDYRHISEFIHKTPTPN